MNQQSSHAIIILTTIVVLGTPGSAHTAPLRVVPVGDSITAGEPFPNLGGYRTRLWQHFGSDPTRVDFLGPYAQGPPELGDRQHAGFSGYTIGASPRGLGSLTAALGRWLRPGVDPDVILLMIGTNDVNLDQDVAQAPARLAALLATLHGYVPMAKTIVSTIPPIDDANNMFRSHGGDFTANLRAVAFNAAIPGMVAARRAAGQRVFFADVGGQLAITDILDGLHPTAAGYAKLGDLWHQALLSVVPEPSSAMMAAMGVFAAGRAVMRRR